MNATYDPGFGPLVQTRMRVVTWNVWGRYFEWEARQPVILDNLRRVDADVVCLQEAWQDGTRSQPEELAKELGLPACLYAPAFEILGAWSGNAVLSRWPVVRHATAELPMEGGGAVDTDGGERRVVLFVELEGPRGPVQVLCTHFSWRADWSGVRQAQARTLCELVASTRPRQFPTIVCGDLNAHPDSDELRQLTGVSAVPVPGVVFRDAWRAVRGDEPGWTAAKRNPYAAATLEPDMRIDYVLVGWPKLGGVGQVLSAHVVGDLAVDGVFGSDHFAVTAELRY